MHKIRSIRNFAFDAPDIADKYDYVYREWLNLPFDFSLQIISGNNMPLIGELFAEASNVQYDSMAVYNVSADSLSPTYTYKQKLDEFKDRCHTMHTLYNSHMPENATIFFYMPEIMLTIPEQQSYMYDYLMTLKNEYDENPGKPFYKHINFFIMTESVFIMSDCLPGNMLIIEGNEKTNDSIFSGSLTDITRLHTTSNGAKIADTVIKKCVNFLSENDSAFISLNFIGDADLKLALQAMQKHRQRLKITK